MKILVTGPSGVIGAGVIPELLAADCDLRLLSRHAAQVARTLPRRVESCEADIADEPAIFDAVAGCDCVLHIAGIITEQPPEVTYDRVNVGGTRHLLEAAQAAGRPRFIYVSSLGAESGESEYHASKRRAERLVHDYAGEWVILRPGNVYGPGDETISLLLKMVRTLPAVPMVEHGDQPFQPIWYEDLGRALARVAAELPRYAGQTLEVAGSEVTTTNELLNRLSRIAGRQPARLPVAAWLAQFGTQMLESFGSSGQGLLQRAGLTPPLNSAKLSMLLEGNLIGDERENALQSKLRIEPTPLQDGLERLADVQEEQLPGSGVGTWKRGRFWSDIEGSRYSADELLAAACDRITEIMPIDFSAEPGAPTSAQPGETLTANIPARGHIQVRLEERTAHTATFVTLESHPLAGIMKFETQELPRGVRFTIHTVAQPSNVFDWLAMKFVGEFLQRRNWRAVVQRVVELSGGSAVEGVQHETCTLDDDAARELRSEVEKMIERRKRSELARDIEAKRAGAGVVK